MCLVFQLFSYFRVVSWVMYKTINYIIYKATINFTTDDLSIGTISVNKAIMMNYVELILSTKYQLAN